MEFPFSGTLFTLNGADITEPYTNNNKSGASNNTLGANDVAEATVVLNATARSTDAWPARR